VALQYSPKPFDLDELKARVRALLRRAQISGPPERLVTLEIGEVVLDLRGRQLHIGEQTIALTPTEFNLLHQFMASPNEVFSAQQLLWQVWDKAPGEG